VCLYPEFGIRSSGDSARCWEMLGMVNGWEKYGFVGLGEIGVGFSNETRLGLHL